MRPHVHALIASNIALLIGLLFVWLREPNAGGLRVVDLPSEDYGLSELASIRIDMKGRAPTLRHVLEAIAEGSGRSISFDLTENGFDMDREYVRDIDGLPLIDVVHRLDERIAQIEPIVWMVGPERIDVVEQHKADRRSSSRSLYDVRDLIDELRRYRRRDFDLPLRVEAFLWSDRFASEEELAPEIIDLITECVDPEAWDICGGTTSSIRSMGGVIIIDGPRRIHDETSQLLNTMLEMLATR